MDPVQNQIETSDLLPWHKPQILRLEVSLDTRDAGGSQGDGEFGTVVDFV